MFNHHNHKSDLNLSEVNTEGGNVNHRSWILSDEINRHIMIFSLEPWHAYPLVDDKPKVRVVNGFGGSFEASSLGQAKKRLKM